MINDFPFMRFKVVVGPKTCKCKGGPNREAMTAEYQRIKEAIRNLPQDRKDRFKALVRADKVTMFLKGESGVEKYEF